MGAAEVVIAGDPLTCAGSGTNMNDLIAAGFGSYGITNCEGVIGFLMGSYGYTYEEATWMEQVC